MADITATVTDEKAAAYTDACAVHNITIEQIITDRLDQLVEQAIPVKIARADAKVAALTDDAKTEYNALLRQQERDRISLADQLYVAHAE